MATRVRSTSRRNSVGNGRHQHPRRDQKQWDRGGRSSDGSSGQTEALTDDPSLDFAREDDCEEHYRERRRSIRREGRGERPKDGERGRGSDQRAPVVAARRPHRPRSPPPREGRREGTRDGERRRGAEEGALVVAVPRRPHRPRSPPPREGRREGARDGERRRDADQMALVVAVPRRPPRPRSPQIPPVLRVPPPKSSPRGPSPPHRRQHPQPDAPPSRTKGDGKKDSKKERLLFHEAANSRVERRWQPVKNEREWKPKKNDEEWRPKKFEGQDWTTGKKQNWRHAAVHRSTDAPQPADPKEGGGKFHVPRSVTLR